MRVDDALEGLTFRLQRILDILADGRRSLIVPEASEWKALALARFHLRRALTDFNAFKTCHILEPLRRAGDTEIAARVDVLERANQHLKDGYDRFVAHWLLNNPVAADAPYREAALKMATEIERVVIGDVQTIETLLRASPAAVLA